MQALFILLLVGLLMITAGLWGVMKTPEVPKVRKVMPVRRVHVAPPERTVEQRLYDEARRQMENEMNTVLLKARHEARKRGVG
jgi:hypothetical protein